jgi:hypothetical protein
VTQHDGPIHGEDTDLARRAEKTQYEVAQLAGQVTAALRDAGYELVVVRVGKVVRGKGGECALPACSARAVEPSIFGCLRLEAAELRRIADEFDRECNASGLKEATVGYTHSANPEDYGL